MSDASDADRAGATARDAEARRAAQQQFRGAFALEAGAGTGKTTVLVARILAWCLGPGWELGRGRFVEAEGRAPAPQELAPRVLRRVAAITFTEAAAAEMATRVGEALVRLEQGELPQGLAAEQLPPEGAERARALLGALDQLSVRTIHAFCRRMLSENPLEVGLHPHFEVDAEERGLAQVAREVVEAHLAEAYAAAPSEAHRRLAQAGQGPREIEAALQQLLRDATPPEALDEDPWTPARLAALRAEVAEALDGFCRLEDGRLAALKRSKKLAAVARELGEWSVLWQRPGGDDPTGLEARLEAMREAWPDVEERLTLFARGEFGKLGAAALDADLPALAERAAELKPLLRHVLRLDPSGLDAARRILGPLLERATRALRARGLETYTALLRDARDLLVGHPQVAARVRGDLDQLLVDEFQDTDRLQCELLRVLALEGPAEERPALFLVGDPKQSIYGWRSADLAAYHEFVERVKREGGAFHTLCVNFRSAPAILAEVDRVVEPVMAYQHGLQPEYQRLVPSDATRDEPGFTEAEHAPVEHWVSRRWDREAGAPAASTPVLAANQLEAEAVAAELLTLRRDHGVPWSRVALLFRTTGDFDVYLGALRGAGIPYVVERDRSYYQRREVIEAIALVRCILDPHDHLALVSVLRSAWVGVPDAALYALWCRRLPALMARLGEGEEHYAAFREAVEGCLEGLPPVPGLDRVAGWELSLLAAGRALAGLRAAFEQVAPDHFVERLRNALAPEVADAARYLGAWRQANLDRFFRELVRALEETGGDVSAVLASLRQAVSLAREEEEGRPKDASESAVQVMTIHRAKGLDFDHVYLMQLHKQPRRGEGPEDQSPVRGAPDGSWEYRLLGGATPGHHRVGRDRGQVEEVERVRTLYVAMTRARRRLVVCASRPSGGAADTHAHLLASRRPGTPDLEESMQRLQSRGRSFEDAAGARWVFPALREPAGRGARPEVARAELPDVEAVRRAADELTALAEQATARARRPFRGVASGDPEEPDAEEELARRFGEEGEPAPPPRRRSGDLSREEAQAVGSAVHAALEVHRADADAEVERRRLEAVVDGELASRLGPDPLPRARQRARRLLHGFLDGALGARFRERVAPHLVARELPVVLPPASGEAGPVGFVTGAIDLVYRDPDGDQWVAVDWKTDEVTRDELAGKARAYARQGGFYTRALQEALALPRRPRFELWFLAADRVEVAPPE